MDQREGREQRVAKEVEVGIETDQTKTKVAHVALGQRVEDQGIGGADQQEGLDVALARHIAQER